MNRRDLLKVIGTGVAGLSLPRTFLADDGKKSGSKSNKPNILFAIADDWGLHAGVYGTPWIKTPNFGRVAKAGVLFMNAYTPNAKCAPSRACVLTGRNPWQNGEAVNHQSLYPKEMKSWMEVLEGGGYFVGSTGKTWGPGEIPEERKNLTGKSYGRRTCTPPAKGINKNDYAGNFSDFMAARPPGKPFCFWYGGHEPHRPYEPGSGVEKGGYTLASIDRVPSFWPDSEVVRNDMLDYAFEVAWFDTQIGKMLKTIEDEGELENTVVVVTSDNGPPFPRMKGHPYEESCHMPLAIMWPHGIKEPGRKCTALVSHIDFAPTFLEVAGLDGVKSGMKPIQGRSLFEIFEGRDLAGSIPERNCLLLGRERNDINIRPGTTSGLGYPVRAIRKDNMLYIHNFEPDRWPCGNPESHYMDTDESPTKKEVLAKGDSDAMWKLCFGKRPSDELYNIAVDPDCMNNLVGNPEYASRMKALQESLFDQLKAQGDLRMLGQGDIYDKYISPKSRQKKGLKKEPANGSE